MKIIAASFRLSLPLPLAQVTATSLSLKPFLTAMLGQNTFSSP